MLIRRQRGQKEQTSAPSTRTGALLRAPQRPHYRHDEHGGSTASPCSTTRAATSPSNRRLRLLTASVSIAPASIIEVRALVRERWNPLTVRSPMIASLGEGLHRDTATSATWKLLHRRGPGLDRELRARCSRILVPTRPGKVREWATGCAGRCGDSHHNLFPTCSPYAFSALRERLRRGHGGLRQRRRSCAPAILERGVSLRSNEGPRGRVRERTSHSSLRGKSVQKESVKHRGILRRQRCAHGESSASLRRPNHIRATVALLVRSDLKARKSLKKLMVFFADARSTCTVDWACATETIAHLPHADGGVLARQGSSSPE